MTPFLYQVPPTASGAVQLFSGNLVPSTALAGNFSCIRTYIGALAPVDSLAADVSVIKGVSGNLAPATALAANLTEVDAEAGNVSPVVSFTGSMSLTRKFVGDMAPSTSLAASPNWTLAVAGNLAPVVSFAADITDIPAGVTQNFAGNLTVGLILAASIDSGPLWGLSEVCPPSMWTPTDPCVFLEPGLPYGKNAYGRGYYGRIGGWASSGEASAPSPWKPSVMCNG